MRGGRLDRLITIRVKSQAQDDAGEPADSWTIVDQRRPASIAEARGSEVFRNPQIGATEQVEFRIRYSANVATLQPARNDIIYPALTDDEVSEDEIPESRIYDILAVHEIGRFEGFKIIAERRPDVTS